jgi:hypothetical protein
MPTTEEKGISRKDFLKVLGAGAVVVAFGGIAGFMTTRKSSAVPNNGNGLLPQEAFAQTSGGTWSMGGNTHATAIHAALLYNGKILYIAGSGYFNAHKLGPFEAGIFDPVTNTYSALPNENKDMFCCGHAMLSNGNILLAGGTLEYDDVSPNGLWLGPKTAWIYDVAAGSFRTVQDMKHGRWYPTLVTLADGKVLTVNGYDEYGSYNRLIEIFDPATESWAIKYDPQSTFSYCAGEGQDPAIMPGAGTQCYGPGVGPNALLYPRMHLMPEGLVIVCGQSKTMRTYDPATGVWKFAGNMLFNASRGYGSSVLLPMQNVASEKGKVLIFGGTATADSFGTTTAEILTLNGTSIVSRWTSPSKKGRKHPIPVILPNGKIMVIGGTEFQNDSTLKVQEAEIFDPVTETWTLLPAMAVPRLYHSSALLLPDGRVWTAGTTYTRVSRELRTEYYSPDYYSVSRPTISAQPVAGDYGGLIVIPTPNPQDIDAVSIIRLGTESHAYNVDQRLIWLQISSRSAIDLTVQAPVNAKIAPPGYYMIHVLKQGIPSKAKMIKIPGGAPQSDITPPNVSITSPANGSTISGPSSGVPIAVTGTASDDQTGIQKVEVKIGSGSFQLATPTSPGNWSTWSYNGTATADGLQPVTARATDIAGNTRDVTINVNVVFDSGFVKIYSVIPTSSYGDLSTTIASRVGEIVTASSSLIGQNIKRVSIIVKKSGNPTGTISVVVRKGSDNAVALTFGTINTSSLTTSDQTFTLTASTAHVFQANDKVLVEWAGTGSSTDKVLVKRKGDSDGFGGTSAYFVAYLTSYVTSSTRDLGGDWYKETGSGGGSTQSQKLSVLAVRASGDDGNVPQNTLDGNLSTRWSNFGYGSWIEYDVAMADVNEVKLAFHKGNKRTNTFRVETTDGVSPLALAGTFKSAKNSQLQSFKFPAKRANRVRVTITAVEGSLWCSVTEAQIWGIP